MRRDRNSDIPFAWYWQGRPLRGNQIKRVYTGAHLSNPIQYACCAPEPVPTTDNQHRSSKTKARKRKQGQEHTCTDPCCNSPPITPETIEPEPESCNCSLCQQAEQYGTAPTTCSYSACKTISPSPSSVYYHAYAHFCCSPYDNPPVNQSSCSCPDCSPFYGYGYYYPPANPSSKYAHKYYDYDCDYPYCSPPPPSAQARCEECYPSDESCDECSTAESSGCDDPMCSECDRQAAFEKDDEACDCCDPAWRYYRDHPAYRGKRI